MGITAPALYRYVDSYQELLLLLGRSIFADVVAEMATARDRYAVTDPAAQIVASAAAFRRWALAHHEEFRLLFASPPGQWADDGQASSAEPLVSSAACPPDNGAGEFSAFFSEIFRRLHDRYDFHVPTREELDPDVLTGLAAQARHGDPKLLPGDLADVPPGMVWLFERAWARLYGTITLEVFGHVHPEFTASGVLFRSTMQDIGGDLGLSGDWDRIFALLRAETLRR